MYYIRWHTTDTRKLQLNVYFITFDPYLLQIIYISIKKCVLCGGVGLSGVCDCVILMSNSLTFLQNKSSKAEIFAVGCVDLNLIKCLGNNRYILLNLSQK